MRKASGARRLDSPDTNDTNPPAYGIDPDQFPVGLPKSFDRVGVWAQRLYRCSPKEIVRQMIEHSPDLARTVKAIRQHGADDYDRILVSLWAEPGLRIDILRRRNAKLPPALELRILDLYLQRHPGTIGRLSALRERFPEWWVLVDMQANHLRGEFSRRLVALSPAFDALAHWVSLDVEEREWVEAVIFAAGSLLSTRLVIDAAIRAQPAIRGCFEYLEWCPQGPLGNYLLPRVDLYAERADYDCPQVWKFLDAVTYFSVDHHRRRFTPYDVWAAVKQVEGLRRLAQPELLREDVAGVLAAARSKFLSVYKSYGIEELACLGIPTPFDFVALTNRMIEFATPVRDMDYSLQMLRRLQAFAAAIWRVMEDARPERKAIAEKLAAMQRLVSEGAAGHVEAVGSLSAEIVTLRQAVADRLRVLLPHKEFSPLPVTAVQPAPSPPVTPETDSVDKDEAILHENQALAAEARQLRENERTLRGQIHGLETRLEQLQQVPRAEAQNVARSVADLAVDVGGFRPVGILRLISMLYSEERVVILPSALKAAEDSSKFQFVPRLYELLTLLITDYRDALVSGRPDAEARHILGNAYRANESELTTVTCRLARLRVFKYEGRDVEMFQHLAIGVDDSEERTIRCHFYWDAPKRRVVIGYLGPHLPTHNSP